MPTPEQLKALADAGGLALFLLAVIAGVVGLWRRWIVPGWIWVQEHEARVRAEAENRVLSVSVARLTAELKALREANRDRRDGRA